jgi:Predicted signal transduction protein with a C-terminal ATPase domain
MARPKPPVSPLDALWRADVVLWVLIAGEGLAIVLTLGQGEGAPDWVYFGLASFWIQWVALLSWGTLYLLRRALVRMPPLGIGGLALGLGLVYCGVLALAGGAILHLGQQGQPLDGADLLLRSWGIALTVGLLGLAAFQNYWRGQVHALRAKQAELEALQARIRPHFLFNTLNTGAALVHQRPEEAERLLLDLADLFRAALAGPKDISLADEVALVRRYLEIEGLRFGLRLRVEWVLPATLPAVLVPALSIQPLVENAIRHGVEPSTEGGTITIEVTEAGGFAQVRVENPLPDASRSPVAGYRVGLRSVQARIQALSHGRGSVETQTKGGRYAIVLRLPLD